MTWVCEYMEVRSKFS